MNNFSFTQTEIDSVIADLGLPKDAFGDNNSERMKIINTWDSCQVLACPGSGKTTVLLAKLLLLAKRMPFKDGSGICVLTHTNVAINEIKNRLGSKADILFKHPNFFGTIQAFVDKFLAIPQFKNMYKTVPRIIDDSIYAKSFFIVKGWNTKDQKFNKRIKKHKDVIFNYLKTNEKYLSEINFICDNSKNIKYLSKNKNNEKLEIKKTRGRDYSNEQKEFLYSHIFQMKERINNYLGILSYGDTYFYAKQYLENEKICEIISERFKFLFIDEMQDNTKNQWYVMDKAFKNTRVKQYFGDMDQAIFQENTDITREVSKIKDLKKIQITESKRFSNHIANLAFNFSNEIEKIEGNNNSKSLSPLLLLYRNPKNVLEEFAKLIQERELDKESWSKINYKYNAVGFNGKESEKKITVKSYFENYKKKKSSKRVQFNTLISYFQKLPDELVEKNGVKVYKERFLWAIIYILGKSGIKNSKTKKPFSTRNFLIYLSENKKPSYIELFVNISDWIKKIHFENMNPTQAKEEFLIFFKQHICTLNIKFKNYILKTEFVTSNKIDNNEFENFEEDNIFYFENNKIKIGSIHSVKGETHLATLLLETENYNESEATYFFDKECGNLFCGQRFVEKSSNGIRLQKRLKTSYVAMTRPSKLLCVALRKEKVPCTKECAKRNKCGWEIIEV